MSRVMKNYSFDFIAIKIIKQAVANILERFSNDLKTKSLFGKTNPMKSVYEKGKTVMIKIGS